MPRTREWTQQEIDFVIKHNQESINYICTRLVCCRERLQAKMDKLRADGIIPAAPPIKFLGRAKKVYPKTYPFSKEEQLKRLKAAAARR